jgi:hypothetical protein
MPPSSGALVRLGNLVFAPSVMEESLVGVTFVRPPQAMNTVEADLSGQASLPTLTSRIHAAAERVFDALSTELPRLLGPYPTQERFRDITFHLINVVLPLSGQEPLSWREFAASYAGMFPDG